MCFLSVLFVVVGSPRGESAERALTSEPGLVKASTDGSGDISKSTATVLSFKHNLFNQVLLFIHAED